MTRMRVLNKEMLMTADDQRSEAAVGIFFYDKKVLQIGKSACYNDMRERLESTERE